MESSSDDDEIMNNFTQDLINKKGKSGLSSAMFVENHLADISK